MDQQFLLSVHVLTYNSEKYIEATIQSILKQKTSFNFEIVIGDDKSTDNTPNILTKFSEEYPNIINYKRNEEQLGILKNFKATLDRCKGKYILDIAGDDLLKHQYSLQKLVDVFEKNPNLGFVDSGYDTYYEKTKKTVLFANKTIINYSKNKYKETLLLGKITPIGTCYKRQALYDYVDFDTYIQNETVFEDYPILVDLVMNTDFDRINKSLFVYRIHSGSYSNKKDFKLQLDLKEQMLTLVKFFVKKYHLPEIVLEDYQKLSCKSKLHTAGYFGDKTLGKSMFKSLKGHRTTSDFLNYLSSQFFLFRKFHGFFRKIK